MTTQEILQSENLIQELAEAVAYNEIKRGDCLMVHMKKGHFSLTPANSVNGKKFQGYVECVSADTLETLVGLGETSDNGIQEAQLISEWMISQK